MGKWEMSTRLLINGSRGRMGQALIRCAKEHADLEVAAEVDLRQNLADCLEGIDCVIDFSHADNTADVVNICRESGTRLVIGTTGQSPVSREMVIQSAQSLPIVMAPNFSVGVNTLFWLTRKATEILGPSFDLEVVEMHHRLKKDAPSGTAMGLAEILAEVREADLDADLRHGRSGMPGERTAREIGMHALRGGDVVGDHTVIYAGNGERLELTHKASSRDTFANGALRAAGWLQDKPPGLYSMLDVLGLHDPAI